VHARAAAVEPKAVIGALQRGTIVVARRPPKIIALIGTPCGSFASDASAGLLAKAMSTESAGVAGSAGSTGG